MSELEDKVVILDQGVDGYAQLLQRFVALEKKIEVDQEKTKKQIEVIVLSQKSLASELAAMNSRVTTLGAVCKKLNEKANL